MNTYMKLITDLIITSLPSVSFASIISLACYILLAGHPHQKKMIRKMKKTIGDSDPSDYITLLDMTVNLWNM